MNSVILEGVATGRDFCFVSISCSINGCDDCNGITFSCEPISFYFTVVCDSPEVRELLRANYREGCGAKVVGRIAGVTKLTYSEAVIIVQSEYI